MKRPTIKLMGAVEQPMSQVKTTPYEIGEYDPKADARRLLRFMADRLPARTFFELQHLMLWLPSIDDDTR